VPSPAVERGPGYPQLGGHLLDGQQRVARGSGVVGRGGGGPAGSGWRSRGRLVRGSATTDALLSPPRQVRPPPGRRRPASARGGRSGKTGKGERPRGRVQWGRGWRAARPCRRGRPAGAGAGWSRAVTSCAPSPLPGAVAASPDAGRRGTLACRPGPQASSLHSARRVKSSAPSPGAGLTPSHEPRVDADRYPGRQERPAPHAGGYREGGPGARTATVRAPVVSAPAPGRRPGTGSPGCGRRVMLTKGSVIGRSLAPSGFPSTTEIGFSGPFFAGHPEKGAGEAKKRGCCRRFVYFRWPFMYLARPGVYLAGDDAGQRPDVPGRERQSAGAAGRGNPAATASQPRRNNTKTARPGQLGAVPAAPFARPVRYTALAAASALAAGSPAAPGAAGTSR
jgi:hypothetical protein